MTEQAQAPQRVSIDQAIAQAIAAHRGGELDKAEQIYSAVLATVPEHADALHLLGAVRYQQGKHQEGLTLVDQAMAVNPNQSFYHNTRGRLLLALNRREDAVEDFRNAVNLDPQNAEAHLNLGEALATAGNLADALASFKRALNLRPVFAEAASGVGRVTRLLGDLGGALPYLQLAAALAPQNAGFAEDVASALHMLGHVGMAIERYETVLKEHPERVGTKINLGCCYALANQKDKAVDVLEEARLRAPGTGYLLDGLFEARRQSCRWDNIEPLETDCVELLRSRLAADQPPGIRGFTVLYLPITAKEIKASNRWLTRGLEGATPLWQARERGSHARIRIAYATADIKQHPMAHLFATLFGLHDRERFEVFVYSWAKEDHSPYRRQIQSEAEHFIDCYRLPDKELAERMASDGIDVLVDLMGHTADCRLGLLARRPAPVQINYLGYPGTYGSDLVDYIIADNYTAPRGHEEEFSERIIRLPYTYQINTHRSVALGPTPSRQAVGLPEKGPVLCAMNNTFKIDPFVFDIWCRLLQRVPDATLWLLQTAPGVENNLRAEAEKRGVAKERLVFAPRWPRAPHLTRLQVADLFLDTRFYNAHTTATDVLWAGVPLLTVHGDRFSARVAESLLHAVGMPELVMPDWESYEAQALRLLTDPEALAQLRTRLGSVEARNASPLFDTRARVRELEFAYTHAWQRHLSQAEPQSFDVPASDHAE